MQISLHIYALVVCSLNSRMSSVSVSEIVDSSVDNDGPVSAEEIRCVFDDI